MPAEELVSVWQGRRTGDDTPTPPVSPTYGTLTTPRTRRTDDGTPTPPATPPSHRVRAQTPRRSTRVAGAAGTHERTRDCSEPTTARARSRAPDRDNALTPPQESPPECPLGDDDDGPRLAGAQLNEQSPRYALRALIGRFIIKSFPSGMFSGEVAQAERFVVLGGLDLWHFHVVYCDGDEESLDLHELLRVLIPASISSTSEVQKSAATWRLHKGRYGPGCAH